MITGYVSDYICMKSDIFAKKLGFLFITLKGLASYIPPGWYYQTWMGISPL